jgi:hypothetical protein
MRTQKLVLTVVALAVSAAAFTSLRTRWARSRATTSAITGTERGDFGTISCRAPLGSARTRRKGQRLQAEGKTQRRDRQEESPAIHPSLNGDRYRWSTGNTGAPNGKVLRAGWCAPRPCKPASSRR